ncbi:glycosyltransferase family 2 protein [Candidatus Nomurabacteria bacterium]|nr:glycosyltransferase family 2 protein [Candidatus Nomurabacteria bacterium]
MSARNKIPCSVGILTFNNEYTLRKCLESLFEFEEIIICDGGSTDKTLNIAREFKCKIINQDNKFKYDNNKISDFSGVRNQTLSKAEHDWFLIVDSDEYLSKDVVDEIREIISTDNVDKPKYFQMLRKYELNGEVIECAGTYPNYQPRFFNKKYVTDFVLRVHEKVYPKKGTKVGFFINYTVVPVDFTYRALSNKFQYYLQIDRAQALSMEKRKLLKSAYLNLRGIFGRWFRILRSRLFCSGKQMPLKFELASTIYSVKLTSILFFTFLKR